MVGPWKAYLFQPACMLGVDKVGCSSSSSALGGMSVQSVRELIVEPAKRLTSRSAHDLHVSIPMPAAMMM